MRKKTMLLFAVLVVCAGLGLLLAFTLTTPESESSPLVKRVISGETQTGEIATTTTPSGLVKRVIRWRTKEGKIVTQTVTGPTHFQTLSGAPVYVPGPTSTVFGTKTLPSGTVVVTTPGPPGPTVTLPGDTVTLPGDTVTVTLPAETVFVTTTVQLPGDTVTVTLPVETVTVTAPAP